MHRIGRNRSGRNKQGTLKKETLLMGKVLDFLRFATFFRPDLLGSIDPASGGDLGIYRLKSHLGDVPEVCGCLHAD